MVVTNFYVQVPVVQAPKEKYDDLLIKKEKHDETQISCKVLPIQESLQQVGNLMVFIGNSEKIQKLMQL